MPRRIRPPLPPLLPLLLLFPSCSLPPGPADRPAALIHLTDRLDGAAYEPLPSAEAVPPPAPGPGFGFDAGTEGWTVRGGATLDAAGGALRLRGNLAEGLLVSPELEVEWRDVHEVVLLLRSPAPIRLRLYWAESEQEFLAFWNRQEVISFEERLQLFRSAELSLPASDRFRPYRIAMRRLDPPGRGPAGPPAILRRLILQAPGATDAELEIDAAAVVTTAERFAGREFARAGELIDDVVRDSIFLRAPGRLRLPAPVRPGSRLELAASLPAGSGEARLRVEAPPGRVVFEGRLPAGPEWHPVEVAFSEPAEEIAISIGGAGSIAFLGSPVLRSGIGVPARRVILYLVDALGARHLGAYGYARPTSPALDRLAGEGVLFLRCIAQSAWTRPSTASILTGLYPPAHGVTGWSDRLPREVIPLAESFRAAGFLTVSFITNPHAGISAGLERGFDIVYETPAVTGSLIGDRRGDGRALLSSGTSLAINRLFLPWLRAHADLPVFVYLHSMDPHFPYRPPPPFADGVGPSDRDAGPVEINRRLYDGDIAFNDREIGRILDLLEILGIGSETTVMVTSDHGEEFGEHGGAGHRNHLHGTVTHVPWILRAPGRVRAGLRVPDRVETIDLLPTLLALEGIPAPDAVQGRSLVPLLRGESMPERPAWSHLVRRTAAEDRARLRRPDPIGEIALREGPWLFLLGDYGPSAPAWQRLYQLENDPDERDDIAPRHPGLVSRFRERAYEWYGAQREIRDGWEDRGGEVRHDEEAERRLRALGYLQ